MRFDLAVIGGGPAGYAAAVRAAKRGMSVLLAESGEIGGTCLNRGCIPTKCLLRSSELFASRSEWEALGIRADNVVFDEPSVYARKDAIVSSLKGGIETLLKGCAVTTVKARARIAGERKVAVDGETVEAANILIATGSRPAALPVKGGEYALNSDGVLAAPLGADEVVIIGGGVVGCELACYYADTGRKVTVVEAAERILPMFSKDIAVRLASALGKRGVTFDCSAKVTEIFRDGVAYTAKNGAEKRAGGAVVVAAGRRANTENAGLETVGLAVGGKIVTDAFMRTSADGIYAAGDARDGIQLAHYAAACAVNAVENMCGTEEYADLSVVPSLVYTDPEIAVVGDLTRGVKSGKFMLGANGKSAINGSNAGFIRVLCDENDVIVAAELMGRGVTETVSELALAIKCGLTAKQIAATVHAHPTVYESAAEACEDIFGLATHKK